MPTYPVTIDGRTFDVIADTPGLAAKKASAQSLAMQRRASTADDLPGLASAGASTAAPALTKYSVEMNGQARDIESASPEDAARPANNDDQLRQRGGTPGESVGQTLAISPRCRSYGQCDRPTWRWPGATRPS
jgi:hypothetical protein